MHEVYFAAYEHDGSALAWRVSPCVVPPGDAPLPPGAGWSGVGNGFAAYPALRERLAGALASCDVGIVPDGGRDRRPGRCRDSRPGRGFRRAMPRRCMCAIAWR